MNSSHQLESLEISNGPLRSDLKNWLKFLSGSRLDDLEGFLVANYDGEVLW